MAILGIEFEYMTLYFESAVNPSVDMFLPHIGFLLFIIAFYKFSPLFTVISDALRVKKQKLLLALVVLFLISFFFGVLNFLKMSTYQQLIEQEQWLVVKGCIENYQTNKVNSTEESFEIGGVRFEYNDFVTPRYFFANRKSSDNFIRNGQCIQVYYFPDNAKNYIVKIEQN